MLRLLSPILAFLSLFAVTGANAQQQAGFDLDGPHLSITVRRGDAALPVTAVPALREGDRLTVRAIFPPDQSARYLLIAAFLRGATNPPPKDWFVQAETWKRKDTLELTVPKGAEQALLFLAPDVGGGFDAVRGAVRGRPGVFVRAAQDLHLASLDQARLDSFVSAVARIGADEPERLGAAAPVLAKSLGIKLNAECLSRPRAQQAACLTQNRETLVLQAQRGSTLTETLTGAPVDLAYRIAATPEGGAGYYSPYIGLARDVARLFGAFRSAQYQYLPALTGRAGDEVTLRLNAAPSFQNPRSVLVAPLPPIGAASMPRFQAGAPTAICLARPEATLPLEDASLLYATGYVRDLHLSVTGSDGGMTDLPLIADAEKGGVRLAARDELPTLDGVSGAILRGSWGFDPFSGPRLPAVLDTGAAWKPQPDATVVVGRDQTLTLQGGAAVCVQQLSLDGAAGNRGIEYKATAPDAIEAVLPLANAKPGALTLRVARYGVSPPEAITLEARRESSRFDRLAVHAGDRDAILTGARLDQVRAVELFDRRFVPGALTRGEGGDRLALSADAALAASRVGDGEAVVTLADGRKAKLPVTIAAPRPSATILNREARYTPPDGTLPIALPEGLVPDDGRLAFSFQVADGPVDAVELRAGDGGTARLDLASGALQRIGDDVVVASVTPHALFGHPVSGKMAYRLAAGTDIRGDWRELARVVRLPALRDLDCKADRCTLAGGDLFLIAAIGTTPDLAEPVTVPIGFVGDTLTLPAFAGDTLYIRLHDAPDAPVSVKLPARTAG